MKTLPRIIVSLVAAAACAIHVTAQTSVATDPVGFVSVNITAGGGTTRTLTPISIPLLDKSTASGQLRGVISDYSSGTITNSSAGWVTGELSTAAMPHILKIMSGASVGRTFLVSVSTANNGTTLTIDPSDLVGGDLNSLALVKGVDTYQLYACDTLASVFGTPATSGILGATNATDADNLIITVNGVPSTYYYNTTNSRWTKLALGSPDATNTPIRPDSGIAFNRLGNTSIVLTVLGDVPTTERKAAVYNSGLSILAQGWPVDIKLTDTKLQNAPNWVNGSSPSSADTVQFLFSGGFRTYWFDGANWRKQQLGSPIGDNDVIPVGTSIIVNKLGSLAGSSVVSETLPYTLN